MQIKYYLNEPCENGTNVSFSKRFLSRVVRLFHFNNCPFRINELNKTILSKFYSNQRLKMMENGTGCLQIIILTTHTRK